MICNLRSDNSGFLLPTPQADSLLGSPDCSLYMLMMCLVNLDPIPAGRSSSSDSTSAALSPDSQLSTSAWPVEPAERAARLSMEQRLKVANWHPRLPESPDLLLQTDCTNRCLPPSCCRTDPVHGVRRDSPVCTRQLHRGRGPIDNWSLYACSLYCFVHNVSDGDKNNTEHCFVLYDSYRCWQHEINERNINFLQALLVLIYIYVA